MKLHYVLFSSMLLLTACTTEQSKTTTTSDTAIRAAEIPNDFHISKQPFFKQQSAQSLDAIALTKTEEDSELADDWFDDTTRKIFLANYANVYGFSALTMHIDDIVQQAMKDSSIDAPTKHWAIDSYKQLQQYAKQMNFKQLDAKNRAVLEEALAVYETQTITKLQNLKQDKLDKRLFATDSLTLLVEKLNAKALGNMTVNHYTTYGHKQIEQLNTLAQNINISYFNFTDQQLDLSYDESLFENSREYELYEQIDTLMDDYLDIYTNNDIEYLSNFVSIESNLYERLVREMEKRQHTSETYRLISYGIHAIEKQNKVYRITTSESYEVGAVDESPRVETTSHTYTMKKIDGLFYITNIN